MVCLCFVHLVSMNGMEEHCILVQDTTESPDESQSVRVRQIGVVGAIIDNPDEWQVRFPSKYTHQELGDCQSKDNGSRKLIEGGNV